jgi:hypothetical protein
MPDLDLDEIERDAITVGAGLILALVARVRELEAEVDRMAGDLMEAGDFYS